MNNVAITGRITSDPQIKKTQSGLSVCSFVIAADRTFRNSNGERQADFIPCVAWRSQADFICKYFKKGMKMELTGSIQSSSYEDAETGKRRTVINVVTNTVSFAEKKMVNEQKTDPVNNVNDDISDDDVPIDDSDVFVPLIDDVSDIPFA